MSKQNEQIFSTIMDKITDALRNEGIEAPDFNITAQMNGIVASAFRGNAGNMDRIALAMTLSAYINTVNVGNSDVGRSVLTRNGEPWSEWVMGAGRTSKRNEVLPKFQLPHQMDTVIPDTSSDGLSELFVGVALNPDGFGYQNINDELPQAELAALEGFFRVMMASHARTVMDSTDPKTIEIRLALLEILDRIGRESECRCLRCESARAVKEHGHNLYDWVPPYMRKISYSMIRSWEMLATGSELAGPGGLIITRALASDAVNAFFDFYKCAAAIYCGADAENLLEALAGKYEDEPRIDPFVNIAPLLEGGREFFVNALDSIYPSPEHAAYAASITFNRENL